MSMLAIQRLTQVPQGKALEQGIDPKQFKDPKEIFIEQTQELYGSEQVPKKIANKGGRPCTLHIAFTCGGRVFEETISACFISQHIALVDADDFFGRM